MPTNWPADARQGHISTAPDYPNGNGEPPVYEQHGMCVCPDARRDDWECPTCHRPSFSAERIAYLQARRLAETA